METIDERTMKQKLHDGWFKFSEKAKTTGKWIIEHPLEISILAASTIGIVNASCRAARQIHDYNEEKESRKEVYCNDVQGYVKLKRELNYKENRELRDRMNGGQTKFEALDEMNLLKR